MAATVAVEFTGVCGKEGMTDFHAVSAALIQAHEKTALLRAVMERKKKKMTPDLERAALACATTHRDPVSAWPDVVEAALRSLLDPSPEVIEDMAEAIQQRDFPMTKWEESTLREHYRECAVAAWIAERATPRVG